MSECYPYLQGSAPAEVPTPPFVVRLACWLTLQVRLFVSEVNDIPTPKFDQLEFTTTEFNSITMNLTDSFHDPDVECVFSF